MRNRALIPIVETLRDNERNKRGVNYCVAFKSIFALFLAEFYNNKILKAIKETFKELKDLTWKLSWPKKESHDHLGFQLLLLIFYVITLLIT